MDQLTRFKITNQISNMMKRLLLAILPLLLCCAELYAQSRLITGKVLSKNGVPVENVTVHLKGTTNGTRTDASGLFKITTSEKSATLTISCTGYQTKDITADETFLTIFIEAVSKDLNEVVVIGYGTARKKDLTGAVSLVTSKEFVKGAVTTPEQLIAGKVPGVQITSNSGQPGSGSRIRIRGGTSLNASNDPLIVIDGVPVDNNGISGAANPLSLINPNDIESFTILKDASASAIYGSRAANGVILISTKKGDAGNEFKINFSSLNSLSVKKGEIDVLSGDEFRALVNKKGTAAEIALLGTANTNWQDEIYQTAFSTDNNISLSGGINRLPYRFSFGYMDQDGILKRSNLKRNSASLNLSPKFFKNHFSVNTNLKYSHVNSFFANQDAIGAAVFFDPTKPIYSGNNLYGGYYEWLYNGALNGLATKNPLGLLNLNENKGTANRFIGNAQLDYKFHFLPDLRANLNFGLDKSNGSGTSFVPAEAASAFTRQGVSSQYEQNKQNKLFEFYLNYVKDIKAIKSRIDLVGGYSWQDWITKSPAFADYKADGTTVFRPAGIPVETQNTLISFYGRLNYALMERYLLTLTMRRDGSSRFSKENRWGNFPSVAAAWNIIDEPFMKNNRLFSSLKLRLGWGITGQQDGIGDYAYQSNIFYGDNTAQYQFGNSYNIIARPQGYDANLKWEETESRNIGLDVGLADSRVNLSFDYYQKNTSDLLAVVPAPAGTNFTNRILTNVGSIKNRGLEFSLNLIPIQTKDLKLSLSYNLTYLITNNITRLQLINDPAYPGAETGSIGLNGNVQINSVGYRPNTFWLYKQIHDQSGKPIEDAYVDKNNDAVINSLDKFWLQTPDPKVFMGFSANLSYKKFTAGFTVRASLGNYMYNMVKANSSIWQDVSTGQNFLSNANAEILYSDFTRRQTWSDYNLEKASFLRMDNAYLNYNIGKVLKGKGELSINFNCQNVFVITPYSGLDPEINGGIDGAIYPRPRTYTFGFNLNF